MLAATDVQTKSKQMSGAFASCIPYDRKRKRQMETNDAVTQKKGAL